MSGRAIIKLVAVATFGLAVAVSETLAADLPPAPPPPPRAPAVYVPALPPPFNWTGFYLGGNLGMGWNHGNIEDSAGLYAWGLDNSTTFGGGGQVGGNYQIGNFVVGVEADFDWFANNNNSGGGMTVNGVTLQASNNGRWLTTVTGRAGFAADRMLFYAKGGGAYVGSDNFTLLDVATGQTVSFNNSSTNTGWTVGGGIEWAFWNNFTARLEYDYVGLSNYSFTVPTSLPAPIGGDTLSTSNRQIQMVTFGLNYLFNGS